MRSRLRPAQAHQLESLAPETDQTARFPRPVIESLGKAGLLGLVSSKQVGGLGLGLAEASAVISRIAHTCPSTAMVVCMHYCATSIIEVHGDISVRKEIAAGRHLSTLAFSEAESRSHFWAPHGTATADGDTVVLKNLTSDGVGGNAGLTGMWSAAGTTTVNSVTYNVYNHSTTNAQVLIKSSITAVTLETSPLVLDLDGYEDFESYTWEVMERGNSFNGRYLLTLIQTLSSDWALDPDRYSRARIQ